MKCLVLFALATTTYMTATFAAAAEPSPTVLVESRRSIVQAPPSAFTDLVRFKNGWYCVFREARGHVSPDGALLAAGSDDGTLRAWQVADGRISGWTLLHARKMSTGERDAGYSHDVAFSP